MPHVDQPAASKTACTAGAPVSFMAHAAWPEDALTLFTLRMADHGFCISRLLMVNDRGYALEQLDHADTLAHTVVDTGLRELTTQLYRRFERQRSGLTHLAHTALY